MASSAVRDDHELARDLADEAGERLLALRDRRGFDDPAALGAEGDRVANSYLLGALARLRPGDAVLSEEAPDDQARLSAGRVWIVDPLDGTREYSEAGRSDWAVHVALWDSSVTNPAGLRVGAVALPAQGATLYTGKPPRPPLRKPESPNGTMAPMRLAVSRSRPPAFMDRFTSALAARRWRAELERIGSAGAKIAAVIRGDVDGYVHAGGQHEWDSAAPVAVALAAGMHASRIDGSPLTYNQRSTFLPDILVCRPEVAAPLLDGLADSMSARPNT